MNRITLSVAFALGLGAGAAGHYLYVNPPREVMSHLTYWYETAPAAERKIIYYRDPGGAPYWSATPRKDAAGRDFLPVYEEEEVSFEPRAQAPTSVEKLETRTTDGSSGERKILYYRNPMGHPDTSPVPKKDSMGMDYIAVYEDEQDEPGTVKVSPEKIQRTGVKTETVGTHIISRAVRGFGTVQHDESLLWIVTVRSDGFIEDLMVNKTGQHVEKGEPLFRFYSSQIQLAQADLIVAMRAGGSSSKAEATRNVAGAVQRLRNLGVPDSRIEEVRKTLTNPRTIDWPSPATGEVIMKGVIEGQRVASGDELFRIADHTRVWVVAEVAEANIGAIKVGMPATVTLRSFSTEPQEGVVTFIYPEMMKPETRTISVRMELANPDGQLKPGMYADVVFNGRGEAAVTAVPDSSVIDSGTRQVVLVAKGEGRFEPRAVKLGRRGGGYAEIVEGLKPGEEVVTSANFLIDAESNLKAALQAYSQAGPPQ
jgi:Cu(I)/Ag(I) efflux system membrane fusion protein